MWQYALAPRVVDKQQTRAIVSFTLWPQPTQVIMKSQGHIVVDKMLLSVLLPYNNLGAKAQVLLRMEPPLAWLSPGHCAAEPSSPAHTDGAKSVYQRGVFTFGGQGKAETVLKWFICTPVLSLFYKCMYIRSSQSEDLGFRLKLEASSFMYWLCNFGQVTFLCLSLFIIEWSNRIIII